MSLALVSGCIEPEDLGAPDEKLASQKTSSGTDPTEAPAGPSPSPPLAEPSAAPLATARAEKGGPVVAISGEALRAQIRASSAKATLVNAWASWCGPCRREFPMLVSMKKNLKKRGVDILFVSVDEPTTEDKAIEFAAKHGMPTPILVAERPLGPFKNALNPKWPGMLPATFLFDAKGNLRYFWGGPVYENEIMPILDGLLAGKNIDGEARYGLIPGKDYRE